MHGLDPVATQPSLQGRDGLGLVSHHRASHHPSTSERQAVPSPVVETQHNAGVLDGPQLVLFRSAFFGAGVRHDIS